MLILRPHVLCVRLELLQAMDLHLATFVRKVTPIKTKMLELNVHSASQVSIRQVATVAVLIAPVVTTIAIGIRQLLVIPILHGVRLDHILHQEPSFVCRAPLVALIRMVYLQAPV